MRNMRYHPRAGDASKGFKSPISEIVIDTFNTGQNKFAAQFTQSQKNVANYLQRTLAYEGYLVAETVRSGRDQIIKLPPPINASTVNAEDQKIIQAKEPRQLLRGG